MAGEEEFEIVPREEVDILKREVENIQKNPLGNTASGRELVRAIKDLTDSVNHLIGLFRDAADAMKLEEKESETISKRLTPIIDKMDSIIDQNERIAKGLVGVADMVKEDMTEKIKSSSQSSIRVVPPSSYMQEREDAMSRSEPSMGPSMSSSPLSPPSLPPNMPSFGSQQSGMPPPPAAPKRKLFGF